MSGLCKRCPAPLPPQKGRGHPRFYCDACRADIRREQKRRERARRRERRALGLAPEIRDAAYWAAYRQRPEVRARELARSTRRNRALSEERRLARLARTKAKEPA